ncbi:hypothetical protein GE21DRAFT_5541 [Neurospora crassa]|uniref:Transcription factor Tos4 n=1 Tax=Neurospora crassa (strain ATCC 24698 / 74-OR23-1A / CBS 708.71 / DSM 1257 / FGSC 987) TaxID=367110 RepID=A7UWT1_NEUCR|nr:transcription factor Tos4 [Neurospora crassa OR74A]EDO65102.2 transcription factor Tos4 [Neurospora crassa OR74A]KHE79101.1 hypothetical protein GE21DRAFT_5541 [Neurospora crassa]|eukprot:XP_001728193.2 transcription factor Tos4 [Neurospora crassa OR74A]
MDSSPSAMKTLGGMEPTLPSVAGIKRPAPSLLPPFEPLSSSPGLPRPSKRQATSNAFLKYPTPIPTSSTGILSSSPPRVGYNYGYAAPYMAPRPGLQRTLSTVSERAPLSDVRAVVMKENGETLLMGRSSNSSHYQLSSNRLVSRVHVHARYIPATEALEPNKVEITCTGWNGLKLHCQGQTWELAKGDSFTSETEGAEIMIDVHDTRVLVQWPPREKDRDSSAPLSDSSWDETPRPMRRGRRPGSDSDEGSPIRRPRRISSPESPTPANGSTSKADLDDLLSDNDEDGAAVEIYEDEEEDEQELPKLTDTGRGDTTLITSVDQSFSISSDLSDPQSDEDYADQDPDEENDPIIPSFGPCGENLSSRLESFTTATSPPRARTPDRDYSGSSDGERAGSVTPKPLKSSSENVAGASWQASPTPAPRSPSPVSKLSEELTATISNHVINQLAFSRLSSTPLSTIMNNLPADDRRQVTKDELRRLIEATACIGIIERQGKDAAGKPLESEYYYVPEFDTDEHRRLAVTDGLRKPSLRACRKQHKQYYWKKPRTP